MTVMTVKILKLDEPTHTGRLYTTETIQKSLQNHNVAPFVFFESDMPDITNGIPLEKVTHSIKNIRIEDGWLIADVELMNTPLGVSLKEMDTSCLHFYTAGIGSITEQNEVKDYTLTHVGVRLKHD